jgi:hypothetical protein
MSNGSDEKKGPPAHTDIPVFSAMPDIEALVARAKSPRTVANDLRLWASEKNILKRSYVPVDRAPLIGWAAQAMSVEAINVLERQAITGFGINERKNTVYVYTNKRVTKSQASILPHNLSGHVKIEYRQARPVVITNDEEESVLGILPYSLIQNRYACGSSVGVGNERMAGTFGCLVRDAGGMIFGLTNNHVTGGCNNTQQGLPIVAPGIMDVMVGAHDPFTLGWHHSVLPMRQGEPGTVPHQQNTDAALIRIADAAKVSSMQGVVYDTPATLLDPEPDMIVEKVRRTTGHQTGVIESEVVGPLPVTYQTTTYHSPEEQVRFVGTVYFEPTYLIRGKSGPFSLAGDSGSLVTTVAADGTRAAIGLIFAGRSNESYMLPLRPILDGFGVKLVGNHGIT